MIHINLIPLREIRVAGRRRLRCFGGVAAIGMAVIALSGLTWHGWQTEGELAAHLETLDRKLKAGRPNTDPAQHLKKQLDTHRQTLSILTEIAAPPDITHEDVLRRIATVTPDPLWLTRLALVNGTLTLEGGAKGHAVIAQFLSDLEALSEFTDNDLAEVHQPKEPPEHGNKRFSVQARIVNRTANQQNNKVAFE